MKRTGRLAFLCLLLIIGTRLVYSQNQTGLKVSLWYGIRDISCTQYPANSNLDFLNFLKANKAYPEDDYLGFATVIRFGGKWEADLRFTVNSGWNPSAFNLKARYFPVKQIGLSAGVFGYPYYINNFELYHKTRDLEYYTDIRDNSNFKQRVATDLGIQAGIAVPWHARFFHTQFQFHGGVSSFSRFSESFGQKRINANLKREILYKTQPSFNWFVMPEAEINLDLLRIKNLRMGIQVQASYYLTNKYINYQRIISTWTYDSPLVEDISSPRHRLDKLEIDFGVYFTL